MEKYSSESSVVQGGVSRQVEAGSPLREKAAGQWKAACSPRWESKKAEENLLLHAASSSMTSLVVGY